MYKVSEDYSKNIAKAVRTTAISGFIRTKDGEVLTINDGNIKSGSLSISSRLNSSGDFKPGGVYSSELSATLLGIAADGLDGARITLNFLLYRGNSDEYDSVPLGTFYVDGSTIQRRGTAVSLKADDGLMNFDYPAEEISGSLHELAVTACIKCDIPLRTTTEEFAALPNAALTASVDTSRIQTWRDLLIFIAMLTGTFVRIERTGGLSFVPLCCERDSGGMIIPVREIAGDIRSSTEFSDDTVRITKLFSRRVGGIISAERNFSGSAEKYAALELMENPLLAELSDADAQTALKNTLVPLSDCLNRAYKTDFNGDPALETGDYVRLRGGSIDTKRGYGTGMITSQVWRYRGKHTIQCSLSSSIPPEESVQTFALRAADTAGTVSKIRVQPKSQLEKSIDSLRGKSGSGGVGKAAEGDPTSEYFNDYENNKIVTYAAGYHHVEGKDNKCGPATACHVEGVGNFVQYGTALRAEGSGNTLDGGTNSSVGGNGNIVRDVTATRVDGTGNTVERAENSYIIGKENIIEGMSGILVGNANKVRTGVLRAIFGAHLDGSAGSRFKLTIGEYNQPISGVDRTVSLAFEIGCGTSEYNRRSCFAVDYEGNVYCNKVIETGSDNILGGAADEASPAAARAARAITSASSAGLPIVLLDHAPTAADLTGSECVFLQCDNTAAVEGETTGIFRVTDIFAEK